jgi:hypothetical protein
MESGSRSRRGLLCNITAVNKNGIELKLHNVPLAEAEQLKSQWNEFREGGSDVRGGRLVSVDGFESKWFPFAPIKSIKIEPC